MGWIYLFIAGILEVGWPIGLKLAQQEQSRWLGIVLTVVFITGSCVFMYLAQKSIPLGIVYAVWMGMGAAGAFLVGVFFFKDPATVGNWIGAAMIIGGVVVMKLST